MTEREAYELVAHLNAGFPNQGLEEATVDLWASEIASWDDVDSAGEAVGSTIRNQQRFPTLAELRTTYQSLRRSRRPLRELSAPGGESSTPEWVQVWQWARVSRVPREVRPFPQQALYGHEESITQAEYEALAREWRTGLGGSDAAADAASFADFLSELA